MERVEEQKTGCVVTGVAGFVGSHLAERLLSLGYPVVGVDNFFSGYRENMEPFVRNPGFTFYERSITEPALLSELKREHPQLSACFHLAAIVSVPYSVDHAEETMHVNYRSSISLLREAEELDFRAFVFAGSAAEYGDDQRLPLVEGCATESTRHMSPYGRAKFLASRAVGSAGCGVSLRFFNIYGPRQDPSSPYSGVISRFMDLALQAKPLTIFGDGLQTRDFVFVSDVVDAYLAAAGIPKPERVVPADTFTERNPSHIYNIGSGRRTSVLELAELLQDLAGRSTEPLLFLPERAGDIRHSQASVDAFRNRTGWEARVSLRDGLEQTLHWYRKAST